MARLRSYAATGGAVLLIALIAFMVVAVLLAIRSADSKHNRLQDVLEPAILELDAFDRAVLQISVTARGYFVTGDPLARANFEEALTGYALQRDTFILRAQNAEREEEAGELVVAADTYLVNPQIIVDSRDRGDVPGAVTGVEEGNRTLEEFLNESSALRAIYEDDMVKVRDDIERTEDRQQVALGLGGGVALAVVAMLFWLARQTEQLTKQLGTERERLGSLVQDVPGVVWQAWGEPDKSSQRIDFVSPYVETMLGYSAAEWLATPNFWLTIVHPDDREAAAARAAEMFAGKGGTNQFRWITKDGRVLDVLAYASVIRDAAGNPAGLRGVTLDISDRKRAEDLLRLTATTSETLASSMDLKEMLAKTAQEAVPALGDWCSIHLLQDGALEPVATTHSDPAKVAGAQELVDRYPPDPNAPMGANQVVRTGKSEVGDIPDQLLIDSAVDAEHLRLLRKVGMKSYICVPLRGRSGIVGALTLVSAEPGRRYDAYDLAAAEDLGTRAGIAVEYARLFREAAQERAKLSLIVGSVSHGVMQFDPAGRITLVNPAAAAMLGYSASELEGALIDETLHQHPSEEDCTLLLEIKGGVPSQTMDTFMRADGSLIQVELTLSPIGMFGVMAGAVIVFQDTTERLKREAMKDDFIAFASHELRSPLTTVNGFAKWLLRRAQRQPDIYDEETKEAIETLSSGADQMGSVIELFLDLTRIDSDRLVLEREEADLAALIQEETDAARMRHPEATLSAEIPDEAVPAFADTNRVKQVTTNLLDNAVKYGGSPAVVHVAMTYDAASATISVRDNGKGIAPSDQSRIFDRFYRSGGQKKSGLGIGLFVSQEIARRLGGSITFTTGEGGTTFVLTMPRMTGDMSRGVDERTDGSTAAANRGRADRATGSTESR